MANKPPVAELHCRGDFGAPACEKAPGPRPTSSADGALANAREADPRGEEVMFDIFSFLLAASVLFHEFCERVCTPDWKLFSHDTVLALAALWCLLRPSSLIRFFVMIGVLLFTYAIEAPFVNNHMILLALVGAAAVLQWGILTLTRRDRVLDKAMYYRGLAPVLRALLVLTYFFAALAKINSGFFDPRLSAAVALYADTAHYLPLPTGAWTVLPAIWGTVFLEGGLVVLLLFRRTRAAALLLAVPFHTVLAAAGYSPLSAVAFALLFTFVPDNFPLRLRRLSEKYPFLKDWAGLVARAAKTPWVFLAPAGIWIAAAAATTYGWMPQETLTTLTLKGRLLFYPYAVGVTLALLLCLVRGVPLSYHPGAFRPSHPVLAIIPALLILDGLCPYLGLKTETSLTMYSNLQTEGDQWNHFFVPKAVRIFSWQNDLVEILSSDDPALDQSAREGTRWVYFEFRRYVSEHPNISVTFEHQGRREEVRRVGDDPALSKRPNLILRKLLVFRDVPPPEKNTIRH